MIYGNCMLILTEIDPLLPYRIWQSIPAGGNKRDWLSGIKEKVVYESAPHLARRTQRLTNYHHRCYKQKKVQPGCHASFLFPGTRLHVTLQRQHVQYCLISISLIIKLITWQNRSTLVYTQTVSSARPHESMDREGF
jgi:hypothetical protein